jgi:PKD repeat protein
MFGRNLSIYYPMITHKKIGLLLGMLFCTLLSFGQSTHVFTSNSGYTVSVTLEVLDVNTPENCQWGYNYSVDIAYDIVFAGSNAPSSMWTLQGQLACGNTNLFFPLPNNGGSGTVTTSNTYNSASDCATATINTLECFNAQLSIYGPQLPAENATLDVTPTSSAGPITWIGTTSSDWDTSTNWQGGNIPQSNDDVIISNGTHQPEISGTINVGDLEILSGASMTFENTSSTLIIKGDLNVLGSFDQNRGVVSFEGSEEQKIEGNGNVHFFDLKVYSGDTVKCMTNVGIRGNLMPYQGVFDFNEQEITLLSNAASTGSIAEIKTGADIVGDTITYQRYFPAGSSSWRMMGSPIENATFEQWNDDFPTTGFPGSDYPNYPSAQNPWSNIRIYEEHFIEGAEADRNFGFQSIGNVTDTIESGKGYFVYFNPGPSTVEMRGAFNRGEISIPLSYTPSELGAGNDGWNLISNPYPASIDWDSSSGLSIGGVNGAIYAYDPNSGQYSSYVNGVSIGSLTSRIASGQAFWVQANPSIFLQNITFQEAAKTTLEGVFMRNNEVSTQALVRIELQANGRSDEAVFGFNDQATMNFDAPFDAYKFYAPDASIPSIAIVNNPEEEERLSISMFPSPEAHTTVQLEVLPGSQGEFILANQNIDAFDNGLCLVLEDKESGVFAPFNEGDLFPFVMDENSDPLRFVIHFNAPSELSSVDESCPDAANGIITAEGYGEAPWTYIWRDEMGEVLQTTYGANTSDQLEDLEPGFYEVEVQNSSEFCGSNVQVVQVAAAPPAEIETLIQRSTCNEEGTGSIEFFLSNEYLWDIEVQDDNYNSIAVLNSVQGNVLVNELNAEPYHLVAVSECGLMADLPSVDLSDDLAPQAGFELSSSEVYVNESIFINAQTLNAQSLVYDFGDGNLDSLNANPIHEYTAPGIYALTQTVTSNDCVQSSTEMIEVFERETNPIDGFEANSGTEDSDKEDKGETLLTMSTQNDGLMFSVKEEIPTPLNFTVYTTAGQRVLEEEYSLLEQGEFLFAQSQLAQGVYVITVQTATEVLFSEQFIQP